jgi:hypothetical protein
MAELEVEQQGSAKANAVEHFSEDVHLPMLIRRTVGHNIRTIEA